MCLVAGGGWMIGRFAPVGRTFEGSAPLSGVDASNVHCGCGQRVAWWALGAGCRCAPGPRTYPHRGEVGMEGCGACPCGARRAARRPGVGRGAPRGRRRRAARRPTRPGASRATCACTAWSAGRRCAAPPAAGQRAEAVRRARRAADDDGGTSLITRFGERGDVADACEVVELADRYGEGWFFGAYKAIRGYRRPPAVQRPRSDLRQPRAHGGRALPPAHRRPRRPMELRPRRPALTLRYRPLGGAETVVALRRAAFPAGSSCAPAAPAPTARAEMLRLRADGVRTVR